MLGSILLIHACYSAYEHSSLHAIAPDFIPSLPGSHNPSKPSLPLDISIETILSVLLICVGLVTGAEELKPISWRVWAGMIEREKGVEGPFKGLEERRGFVDIRVSVALGRFGTACGCE
ncbi:hypothetical protein MMC06_004719 [Schaereria dolodes]|nr:hypothetical protein [Schaereria dolodes]